VSTIQAEISKMFAEQDIRILMTQENQVVSTALGPNGRLDEPCFWQVAALNEKSETVTADHLYELHVAIEARYHVHVASLSNVTASYKVMGAASILPKYFKDL